MLPQDCGVTTENETNEWYTVCSKPHTNYQLFVAVVGAMALVGIAAFQFCFGPPSGQKSTEPAKKKNPQQKKKKYI